MQQTQGRGGGEANDLTQRIPLDGKTGEIEKLCTGVNGLIGTMSERGVDDASGLIDRVLGRR